MPALGNATARLAGCPGLFLLLLSTATKARLKMLLASAVSDRMPERDIHSHQDRTPTKVPTYDGVPAENVSIEDVKGQVTKTPGNFTVEVFSIEGAGQRKRMSSVRFREAMASSSVVAWASRWGRRLNTGLGHTHALIF